MSSNETVDNVSSQVAKSDALFYHGGSFDVEDAALNRTFDLNLAHFYPSECGVLKMGWLSANAFQMSTGTRNSGHEAIPRVCRKLLSRTTKG